MRYETKAFAWEKVGISANRYKCTENNDVAVIPKETRTKKIKKCFVVTHALNKHAEHYLIFVEEEKTQA